MTPSLWNINPPVRICPKMDQDDGEEVFGAGIPYLSTIGALLYMYNHTKVVPKLDKDYHREHVDCLKVYYLNWGRQYHKVEEIVKILEQNRVQDLVELNRF
ncbi:hypothetical protein OSB04_023100 [Centaurea solstitialis]|uniref:Uncharacterized protein n=1 Tax=Centaurea solstitialis TaxID=347529 RepID=A0AA38SR06_9ASTR|nr:hypothetical protein OSB04_023100 [Centaurea solstitialis]